MNESEIIHSKKVDEKYCPDCGNIIKSKAEICPKCGVRQLPPPETFGNTAPGKNKIAEKRKNVPNTMGHAAWGCLAVAWICFLLPFPGLGIFIGWTFNLVAFILAIVAMSKRGMMGGFLQLIASLVVSPIVYLIGLGIFASTTQFVTDRLPQMATPFETTDARSLFDLITPAIEQITDPNETQMTDPNETQTATPSETIDAKSLFEIYKANEVAGDVRFKGKRVIVTGIIGSINSDVYDNPTVILEAEMFSSVHLNGIDKNLAVTLSKGRYIVAECTGDGEIMGSPIMKDCKLNN